MLPAEDEMRMDDDGEWWWYGMCSAAGCTAVTDCHYLKVSSGARWLCPSCYNITRSTQAASRLTMSTGSGGASSGAAATPSVPPASDHGTQVQLQRVLQRMDRLHDVMCELRVRVESLERSRDNLSLGLGRRNPGSRSRSRSRDRNRGGRVQMLRR